MKLLLLACFFIFSLTACSGYNTPDEGNVTVDPAFAGFLQRYKDDKLRFTGTSATRAINITFYTLDAPTIGECSIFGGHYRSINIDPAYWFYASINDKLTLFYHEMGHCDLNILDHVSTNTIMNAWHLSGSVFNSNPNFYLNELFVNRR